MPYPQPLSATDQQIEIRLFRGAVFIGVIVVTTLSHNGFDSGSNKVKARLRIFLAESPTFCTRGFESLTMQAAKLPIAC
jgi:hypothetical protein